jgi:hypothetical protein
MHIVMGGIYEVCAIEMGSDAIMYITKFHKGARGSVVVKALYYKPEDRGIASQ